MIMWPSSLPCQPLQGTWGETVQRNVAIFSPEVGAPKYRRRTTASGSKAAASFYFTKRQLADFQSFYADDLKDGSLPFSWQHPITDTISSWCFEDVPEVSSVNRAAYTVNVQLRRLP
jgi:hypothetical protein